MTVGEKIKSFRSLKQLSQKALAEKAGVSEIAIRKYEAGERNPKPEQLKKIAQALDIGENILFDIPLNTLELNTVGDVMALFFVLYNQAGLIPMYNKNKDGEIDPATLTLRFTNERINELIAEWLQDKSVESNSLDLLNQRLRRKKLSHEDYEELFFATKSIIELTQQKCMEDSELLDNNK